MLMAALFTFARWPNGPNNDMTQYYSSKVSWYYTWSPWDVQGVSLDFIPMFWGVKQVSDFQAQVTPAAINQNGWEAILGMNEPEQPTEANINAGQGAAEWQVRKCFQFW